MADKETTYVGVVLEEAVAAVVKNPKSVAAVVVAEIFLSIFLVSAAATQPPVLLFLTGGSSKSLSLSLHSPLNLVDDFPLLCSCLITAAAVLFLLLASAGVTLQWLVANVTFNANNIKLHIAGMMRYS